MTEKSIQIIEDDSEAICTFCGGTLADGQLECDYISCSGSKYNYNIRNAIRKELTKSVFCELIDMNKRKDSYSRYYAVFSFLLFASLILARFLSQDSVQYISMP